VLKLAQNAIKKLQRHEIFICYHHVSYFLLIIILLLLPRTTDITVLRVKLQRLQETLLHLFHYFLFHLGLKERILDLQQYF
jgi:hypothetical protein